MNLFKLKAFGEEKNNSDAKWMTKCDIDRMENIVGKGENACCQDYFLSFSHKKFHVKTVRKRKYI